jgi:WD40 repeat protein
MPSNFTYDVFLSHNSQDKPRVLKLAERLRDAGLRVWFDDWVIRPGDDIYLAIEHGLEAARVQVLCLSPAALGSQWVSLERSTVLFRDPGNAGRRFVPLLLTDCTLPDTLRRYKYVDFRGEAGAAFEELLSACRPEAESLEQGPRRWKPKARRKAKPHPELAVLERELTGHKGWVNSVAVSPDGMWAVSGSDDKTVKIWDLETGACRATLNGHTEEVNSVAIMPDGRRILSVSDDGFIRVWDAADGKAVASWKASEGLVCSVAAAPDGRRIVTSEAAPGTPVKIWDVASQRCLSTMRGHTEAVACLAVSYDGERAVSGSNDDTARIWNLETSECLATLKGHLGDVESVQIAPDGRFAVSGSNDKTVKIWDLV